MTSTETKEEENPNAMEYRMLGSSGLKVSVLGFGTMTFNSKEQAIELMECARKGGVNFFDNAELYGEPLGQAEVYFGQALKELQKKDSTLWRRSDLVITTKLYFGPSPTTLENKPDVVYGENEKGTSMKHLIEGMAASLKRMQLSYVDVVYAHRYDPMTPVEETVRAFTEIIRRGQAFYWGTSCWPPIRILEAYWIAKSKNLIAPIVEQPVYNMFSRQIMEDDYVDLFQQPYNIGTTVWSPLDSGFLTGKYNNGVPKNSRFSKEDRLSKWFSQFYKFTQEEKVKSCQKIQKFCDKYNFKMVHLALAWVIKNRNVSVCLLGAKNSKQLQDNFNCLGVARKFTNEMYKELEETLGNKPTRNPVIHRPFRSCQSTINTSN